MWTCCRFSVESTTNPQHLDMSRCCGFVVDLLYGFFYHKFTSNRSDVSPWPWPWSLRPKSKSLALALALTPQVLGLGLGLVA